MVNTSAAEHRRWFERLCAFRDLYAHRGPRDSVSAMTLDELVRYADALLRAGSGASALAADRSADSTV